MTINWEGMSGIRETDAEVTCADCEWRLRIVSLDTEAVQRAVTVALADHRRAFHNPAWPAHIDGADDV